MRVRLPPQPGCSDCPSPRMPQFLPARGPARARPWSARARRRRVAIAWCADASSQRYARACQVSVDRVCVQRTGGLHHREQGQARGTGARGCRRWVSAPRPLAKAARPLATTISSCAVRYCSRAGTSAGGIATPKLPAARAPVAPATVSITNWGSRPGATSGSADDGEDQGVLGVQGKREPDAGAMPVKPAGTTGSSSGTWTMRRSARSSARTGATRVQSRPVLARRAGAAADLEQRGDPVPFGEDSRERHRDRVQRFRDCRR